MRRLGLEQLLCESMLAFAALLFIIPLIQGLSTPPSALRYPFEQTPNWIKLEESPARIISQISWSSEKLSNGMTLQRDFITITTSIEVSRRFLDKWNVNVIGVQIVAEYTGDVSNLQPDIQVALHTSSVRIVMSEQVQMLIQRSNFEIPTAS